MEIKSTFNIHKKGIVLHRLVYTLFFLQRVIQQFIDINVLSKNTVMLLTFLALCVVVEEICYRFDCSKYIGIVCVIRYIQCLVSVFLVGYLQIQEGSKVMMVGLVILQITDYFLTMGFLDRLQTIICSFYIGIPIFIILIFGLVIGEERHQWIFWFFDVLIMILVLFSITYVFVDYIIQMEEKIFAQNWQLQNVVEQNENILNMQEKLKNSNAQLNLQKIELQNAYKQIQTSNQEMAAQADIMRYIAMSFDVSKISNQITDAIMQVKELGFCAVYIKEGAYLNKYANYVIKTNMGPLQSKIKDNIADIYTDLIAKQQKEIVYHSSLKTVFPFLKDFNINSVYIKVLSLEDENYGLFMIGDSREEWFCDNMSFYDAIIAQYDIALNNAKIYNDMKNMAKKDGLTQINNRICFNQLFSDAMEKIVQENGYMSVSLIDIDKFKSVNDTYGHFAGDDVIKSVASIIERCIEKYDGFVCRYGGEEFVAALPNTKLEVAQSIIEELFDELCAHVVIYNHYEIPISVSIGLTSYPEICKNADELLKRADWCMYYAKEHGRHQVNIDDGSIENV